MLKKAYWMEIETVMSYITNSINPDGVRAQEIIESLQQDIQEELGHAQQFAERIKELYGVVPGSMEFTAEQSYLQPPEQQTDIVHVIKGVIEAETGAIEHYNRSSRRPTSTDPVTNDMVIAILRDEEGHRRLFEGYLREYEAEGKAYRAAGRAIGAGRPCSVSGAGGAVVRCYAVSGAGGGSIGSSRTRRGPARAARPARARPAAPGREPTGPGSGPPGGPLGGAGSGSGTTAGSGHDRGRGLHRLREPPVPVKRSCAPGRRPPRPSRRRARAPRRAPPWPRPCAPPGGPRGAARRRRRGRRPPS